MTSSIQWERTLLGNLSCSYTVNSLQDGHLWDRHQVSVLERCPSYRESNKRSIERQGLTLSVRLQRCPSDRGVR